MYRTEITGNTLYKIQAFASVINILHKESSLVQ